MNFDLSQFIISNEKRCHDVLDLIPVPLFVKDVQGRYLTCNKAYEKISGLSRREMIGNTVYDLWPESQADIFYSKDKELFESFGQQVYEADIGPSFGRNCIVQFHKITFSNGNGETIGLLGAIFDITDKKELEKRLLKLSQVDDLTGFLNRRTGLELMNQVLKTSKRKEHELVIAVMDLDHYKSINDTYGHGAGDMILQSIESFTSKFLRDYDIVCRYGGEEFVFCFPETNIDEACAILERIRAFFESNRIILEKGKHISVTVSIGVASYPDHAETIDELISAGDKAMYEAKSAGRNRIEISRLSHKPRN